MWGTVLDWIETHPGAAAWAQGMIGTVGLGIAIYVPWRIRHDERAEAASDRKLRSRSLALAIYPELLELKIKLNVLDSRLRSLAPPDTEIALKPDERNRLLVPITPALERNVDNLYILGSDAGGLIQQLIATMAQTNRMIEAVTPQRPQFNPTELMERHVALSRSLTEQALTAVAPIHDGE